MSAPPSIDSTDQPSGGPQLDWPDSQLVAACLRGDGRGWSVLVEKYKSLVYSIAVKHGASPDEAADIFQTVWVDVYRELAELRKRDSLRSWLISVTRHKCYHWRQRRQRDVMHGSGPLDFAPAERLAVDPVSLDEVERDQLVREAIFALPPRCRELIRLLFYRQPPLRYREVAQRLGLAIGSIGFIRGRCLKRLQRNLERQDLV